MIQTSISQMQAPNHSPTIESSFALLTFTTRSAIKEPTTYQRRTSCLFGEPGVSMPKAIWWIAAAALTAIVVRLAIVWLRYRGQRLITCPENSRPAGVRVNAGQAATTALTGPAVLRLSSCTRWPEKAGCGQWCLSQIAAAPVDCLV